jgi:hypothetical protein
VIRAGADYVGGGTGTSVEIPDLGVGGEACARRWSLRGVFDCERGDSGAALGSCQKPELSNDDT